MFQQYNRSYVDGVVQKKLTSITLYAPCLWRCAELDDTALQTSDYNLKLMSIPDVNRFMGMSVIDNVVICVLCIVCNVRARAVFGAKCIVCNRISSSNLTGFPRGCLHSVTSLVPEGNQSLEDELYVPEKVDVRLEIKKTIWLCWVLKSINTGYIVLSAENVELLTCSVCLLEFHDLKLQLTSLYPIETIHWLFSYF